MTIELYAQEKRGEKAESRRLARASFLRLILELRPQCVSDLRFRAFLEFVFVVSEQFKHELLKGTGQKAESGKEAFVILFLQAMQERIAEDPYNTSIDDVLCVTFGKFHVIDSQTLERVFPNWKQIKRFRHATDLCNQLSIWSTKWNLDADW